MHVVFKTSKLVSWRYEMNTWCPLSLVTIKKDLFFLFNAAAESANCSLLKKSTKVFLVFVYKKNFVKHIENLPQHLSEKFIGDNLSITDIASRN